MRATGLSPFSARQKTTKIIYGYYTPTLPNSTGPADRNTAYVSFKKGWLVVDAQDIANVKQGENVELRQHSYQRGLS